MNPSFKIKAETYILIEEDAVPVEAHVHDLKPPKVVRLRNVAYVSSPVSDPSLSSSTKSKKSSESKTLSRVNTLEALMPLSRVPWGMVPTLVDQRPRNFNRQ
ncbi:hypothetical protein BGX21_003690 [Mortierella sp. AD011]|nr:hypothetical protein BGX20_004043 [Mortierella sp. AD010]KAF9400702.1 hypothetical protein BGX21_003690 [Mortierella sp. AD011]